MKVVILAGGLGTRLSEETDLKPKPMVEIGGRPILWHIMKMYSYYGFNDFIILTGYKSHVIKDYFINYYTRYSDITVDMTANSVEIHKTRTEPWKVTMLYTGQDTMTGGRIAKAKEYVFVTIKNNIAVVTNEKRESLIGNRMVPTQDETMHFFSKSKLNELLQGTSSTSVSIELRGTTLTLSTMESTMDLMAICPPLCF